MKSLGLIIVLIYVGFKTTSAYLSQTTTFQPSTSKTLTTDIGPCAGAPCGLNGSCLATQGNTNFTCNCSQGYYGRHCDHNVCDMHPCQHGICLPTLPYFTCQCNDGFSGKLCEVSLTTTSQPAAPTSTSKPLTTDIGPCAGAPCGLNGSCLATQGNTNFTCNCSQGYYGRHCDHNVCDMHPCQHGICLPTLPYFTCQCNDGFSGKLCEVSLTTTSQPAPPTSASKTLTTDIGPCGTAPCGLYGSCLATQSNTNFTCSCSQGYYGRHCDHNVCDMHPCQHGICLPTLPFFTCQCDDGFSGKLCEVLLSTTSQPAAPASASTTVITGNPCQSHQNLCGKGACVTQDTKPYYRCKCPKGVIGLHCEHDVCDTHPCQHGSCFLALPYFSCQCDDGFSGTLCEVSLTTTSQPAPSASSSTSAVSAATSEFRACDKYNILSDIVDQISVENNKTMCNSGSHNTPEAFVINNCNVTSSYASWKKGIQVMSACGGGVPIPTYTPVGIFVNGSYLDVLQGGTVGVFFGCLAGGGFKLGVQDCDSRPVIKHINGTLTMNPNIYFTIV